MRILSSCLAAGICLSACTSVPMASLTKLARIDFMTTDLASLRVAVALPIALAPKRGGVLLETKYKVGDAPEQTEKLALVQTQSLADKQGVPASADSATYVFQLAPADVQRLNALRAKISEAKSRREKGSLGLGVSAKEFCKLADLPDGALPTDTYIKTSENDGYVTLLTGYDLRSETKIAESLKTLQPCT